MQEIFKYFISKDSDTDLQRIGYIMWFCDTFPLEEFSNEDKLFRAYAEFSSRLQVPMKSKYLESFLYTELEEILIREHIHVTGTSDISFDDPVGLRTGLTITKEVMRDYFNHLDTLDNDVADFRVAMNDFIQAKLKDRLTECLSATFEMQNKTGSATIAADYAQEKIAMLKDIYDVDNLEELDEERKKSEDITHMELLTDFGIPLFDNDIRGLHRKQLGGIEAQPGAGKTRFALGVVLYRAAVIHKRNVLFFTLEQSVAEMENILIAKHVYMLFDKQISDEMLNYNTIPDDIKPLVQAARLDLFESGKYGKIIIKEDTLYLESFITKIKTLDNLKGPFDVIIIDYMSLIEQEPSKPGQYRATLLDYQIWQRAYKWFKRYVRKMNKGGLAVNQLNSAGEDAGKADKDIQTNMAQGGMEVYRSTDWNLAMTFTVEQKAQNKRKFSQPKVRGAKGFGSGLIDVRLGFAHFYQKKVAKI